MAKEDGWTVVRRRGGGRSEQRRRKGKGVRDQGESFFVRNFPDWCTVDDLRWRFEEIDRMEDVFIPGKRDLKGLRFAFVRFGWRVDRELVLDKLNKIWFGSFLLRAFIPKFDREARDSREVEQTLKGGRVSKEDDRSKKGGRERQEGSSDNNGRDGQGLKVRSEGDRGKLFSEVLKGVKSKEGGENGGGERIYSSMDGEGSGVPKSGIGDKIA